MLGTHWQKRIAKPLLTLLVVGVLALGIGSCTRPEGSPSLPGLPKSPSRLSEVAPPEAIQELRKALDIYQPQVKILSPRLDEILKDTQVSVRLQVNDLPLFQDDEWGLGPHLHFILDNQPYEAVYDTKEPIVLKDLAPGTHTLRVFASRPWHESFKNEGAYAQTTFHLFAKTPENNPDLTQPLLTYSRPKGTYGAEPIMLDFYLANAPLHLVAREDNADEIRDWQIRCTINGESFVFDRWEPIHLKGLEPGRNWVQLELLDENGTPYPNAFNNTIRLIDYQPGGSDTLSKLVRGELTATDVFKIVDPNYVPPAPQPEPLPEPETLPEIVPGEPIPTEPGISPAVEAPIEPPIVPGIEESTELPTEASEPSTRGLTPEQPAVPISPELSVEPPAKEGIEAVEEALQETKGVQEDQAAIEPASPEPPAAETLPLPSTPLPEPELLPAPTLFPAEPAPLPQPTEPDEEKLFNRAKGFFNRVVPRRKSAAEPTVPPATDLPPAELTEPAPEVLPIPSSDTIPTPKALETPPPAALEAEPSLPAPDALEPQPPAPTPDRSRGADRYYPPVNLTLPLPL